MLTPRLCFFLVTLMTIVTAFVPTFPHHDQSPTRMSTRISSPFSSFSSSSSSSTFLLETSTGEVGDEIIARRITVKGDVQGGYYRACVLNEVRFSWKGNGANKNYGFVLESTRKTSTYASTQ